VISVLSELVAILIVASVVAAAILLTSDSTDAEKVDAIEDTSEVSRKRIGCELTDDCEEIKETFI